MVSKGGGPELMKRMIIILLTLVICITISGLAFFRSRKEAPA